MSYADQYSLYKLFMADVAFFCKRLKVMATVPTGQPAIIDLPSM